jgi:hypothetical protein
MREDYKFRTNLHTIQLSEIQLSPNRRTAAVENVRESEKLKKRLDCLKALESLMKFGRGRGKENKNLNSALNVVS